MSLSKFPLERKKIIEKDQNQVWSEALGGGETASGERRPHVPPAHRLILVLYFYDFFYLLFFAVLSTFTFTYSFSTCPCPCPCSNGINWLKKNKQNYNVKV